MKFLRYLSIVLLVSSPLMITCAEPAKAPVKVEAPKIATPAEVKKEEPKKELSLNYVVVDAQQVIGKTQIDQEFVQELTKLQQTLQKELKDFADEIQKEDAALKAKASTLAPDALKKKQEELEEKNQKAQLKLQRANKQLQDEEMKTRFKVFQKLHDYAQEVIDKEGNIDIMFEKSGGILAFSTRADKSDALSAFINKKEAAKKKVAPAPTSSKAPVSKPAAATKPAPALKTA